MKKIILFSFFLITIFPSCGKKEQQNPTAQPNAEQTAKKAQKIQPDTTSLDLPADTVKQDTVAPGIEGIKEVWRDRPITLEVTTVNIQTLAKTFCENYPGFEPNRVLRDHFDGKTTPTEQQDYAVNLEARNGYVCIETTTELPTGTTICYWNRKYGHKLLAVWMEQKKEGENGEQLLAFYDYDPSTKVLQPEPKLTDELERITKKFKEWSLRLPAEGKDIEIMEFSGTDSEANFKCIYYTWKWNGQSFRFDPNGHE